MLFFNFLSGNLSELLEQLLAIHSKDSGLDRLVRESAQGHIDIVRDIITKYPDKVSHKEDMVILWHWFFF